MCGRYTLVASQDQLTEEFDLQFCEPVTPNRNIRPTQLAPVVRTVAGGAERRLQHLRWGLVPPWSKAASGTCTLINARSEEAATKLTFRQPFRNRRCLIPCFGFYEWKAVEGAPKSAKKQAFVFLRPDEGLLALGGLWETWEHEGEKVESFAILTRSANDLVQPLHYRMPVIIERSHYDAWLDPMLRDAEGVQDLIRRASQAILSCGPVDVS